LTAPSEFEPAIVSQHLELLPYFLANMVVVRVADLKIRSEGINLVENKFWLTDAFYTPHNIE